MFSTCKISYCLNGGMKCSITWDVKRPQFMTKGNSVFYKAILPSWVDVNFCHWVLGQVAFDGAVVSLVEGSTALSDNLSYKTEIKHEHKILN